MIQKSITFLIATMMTLGVLWAIGFLWFAASVSTMAVPPATQKTDAIVVLTGAEGRVDAGLKLLKDGAADKLFISGVNKKVNVAALTRGKKVPCCITLGYEATDTKGNADETAHWVKDHDIKSIRLVTSSYHIPRALLELGRQMPGVTILNHPVKTGNEYDLTARPYWALTFREYNKTILTWVRLTMSGEKGSV
jgi:uncharacterized SAM-binding protein YcdF (DUF218 family)